MDPKLLADGTILYLYLAWYDKEVKNENYWNKPQMAHIGSWEIDIDQQKYFWSDEVHELHETNPKTLYLIQTGIEF
jgi:hypothetical protein